MSSENSVDASPSVPISSVPHLLKYHSERTPDAPAILAPGRAPLSYIRLYQHVDHTARTLRAMGIGRHDRVVVVLPNGPEMAVAILTVEACAVCVPLNPAYEADELERYFADLQPRALIVQARADSPARRVALSRGVRVIELSNALDTAAGLFTLTGDQDSSQSDDSVSSSDVALLLLTSGTTSRPKIVPLTHANICTSAYSSVAALALKETDRCLNVLPLFHGHGLNATVLASLAAGASVVCTPGLNVNSFFAWLTACKPTWYSAVPTMHKAILARAWHDREQAAKCGLRFIRSASAALPPRVFAQLEQTFETCVIEFYGMTETASAPISCNPLPPRKRKAGSVGVPLMLDVAIMDEGGALVPGGGTGHIVVRGASVASGYDGDLMASQTAFAGDWLKTGDVGFFDDDGYLFLIGRSREIINRGGEKIAPQEIDDILLEHPAVADAVTFAMPHATLGEDVAAAIVLRPQAAVTPRDIRQFVIGHIADFKVPRQVLIVDELPKGPTGKVQRVGLAEKLGLTSRIGIPPVFVAPRTPVEKMLAECWAEILQLEQVGVHDDFFGLGGDSLSVAHVLAHLFETMHFEVDAARFFEAPTIAELAEHLETLTPAARTAGAFPVIARELREDGVPASIVQERLWKLQRAVPGIPFFNILYALRLTSAFDAVILEQSLNEIVRRHEILRTTFAVVDGQYVQTIAPHLTVRLRSDDLRTSPEPKKKNAGEEILQQEILHSFDFAEGPLFRARLVCFAEHEHLLLISMHQTIADGWSLGVLVDELTALYDTFSAGATSPLAPLTLQYADFASWQRHWRSHPEIIAQLEYWREQLRDPLPMIRFGTGRPRSAIDVFRTARRELALPASLSEAAKALSYREGGTLFMALVAALKTLLHCYLGQEDLRVATLVANRNRPGTQHLIGPLVNTVILRTNLGGDPSPQDVMRRVRATTFAAFANQDLPFEELVAACERERGLEPAALSQVMITLHNATLRPVAVSSRALAFEEANPNMPMPLVALTTFDVILTLHEGVDGLVGSCVYKPYLFAVQNIDRLLQDFRSVLEQMVMQPERPISAIRVALNANSPTHSWV